MPELPEVETVRDGLARHVLGRTVERVEVFRDYSVRRHLAGPVDFAARLRGRTLRAAVRRGKFLWLETSDGDAVLAHLGMSGQLLVRADDDGGGPHLRVRLALGGGVLLDFVDQRTFGYLAVADLVPTPDGLPGGRGSALPAVPGPVSHIARDLLDPAPDRDLLVSRFVTRRTSVKRALLDQTLVSGVGNIYADEALWRAQLHFDTPADTLSARRAAALLDHAAAVMAEALGAGGTSFDALYVNVNGASGYFDRSLTVYGQAGRPCPRCGSPIRREKFTNRSAFFCPACQPPSG